MSLSRIALRIAAVEALKGKTMVGSNVLDSPNGALDVQADGALRIAEERPFISVYTDVGKAEIITGRSLVDNGICDIVFEIGVSTPMLQTNSETGETTMIGIEVPASDRSFEFFLDVVQRQIADALTDPANAWADIYRALHYRVVKTEYVGARNTDSGARLAGHQLRVTVDLAEDPVRGEPLPDDAPMMQFLSALEASDDQVYQTQAAAMRACIAGNNERWSFAQRKNGMTAAELLALGLGPLAVDPNDGSVPEFEAGAIEVEGSHPVEVSE